MLQYLIPVIGSRGVYSFLPPFDVISTEGVEYTCQAVRRIGEYLANNEDPKALIYDKYSLPETVYDEDREANAFIVSLQSNKGHWLYVPYRYIQTFPSGDGIQYCSRMLVFSLPSIPAAKDLTDIVSEIKDRIKGSLGVDVSAKEVESSQVVLVTQAFHEQKELERSLQKTGSGLLQRVVFLEAENASLRQRLLAAEAVLKQG